MHVLILPSWYPTPAAPIAGIFFREQAEALQRAGAQVGVIYPDLRSLRTLRRGRLSANRFQITSSNEEGIPTLRYQSWALPRMARFHKRRWIKAAMRLGRQYLRRHGRPDLIHAHSVLWAGVAARQLGATYAIPYVLTEHRGRFTAGLPDPNLLKAWYRPELVAALHASARIIAVSTHLARGLERYVGDGLMAPAVVPNMVDVDFFTPRPDHSASRGFHFLTVANLTPGKGIHFLIKAFAEVARVIPDTSLEIGGQGPQAHELRSLVERLAIGNRVRFLGALSRTQVREAMQRANCFVLPTLMEAFGIVLVEAIAMGVPVISTRSGGPEDIITPDVGRLVEPGNIDELTEAMLQVHARRTAWDARHIRAVAVQRYSRSELAGRITQIYADVVAGPRRRADGSRIAAAVVGEP